MDSRDPATLRAASQAFGVTLAVVGAVTVLGAPQLCSATARDAGSVPDARIARVLGARQAVQGLLVLRDPSAAALGLGAAVDLAHAASMLPVAAWAKYRRPALLSGAMAAASALVGTALARRAAPRVR